MAGQADTIRLQPRVTVEKYSPDQASWASVRFAQETAWAGVGWREDPARDIAGRLLWGPLALSGDDLRCYFPLGPEDGYAYDEGNALVNGGLDALASLLMGTDSPQTLATGHCLCGVGTVNTAWAAAQTALGADGTANAFYQATDSTYPKVDGTIHGQIDGQCTFASGSANFSWAEWCYASSTGTSTGNSGTTLATVVGSSTQVMFNRKVPASSLGTKAAGSAWVFTVSILFS